MIRSSVHGLPRIGPRRELKAALEAHWAGEHSAEELADTARSLRRENWELLREAGIDLIPSNDFSLYDHVLDAIALTGAVPLRYGHRPGAVDLDLYFAMARGTQDVTAMEMTKWFDTNYHYIVPELGPDTPFRLASTKPFDHYSEAKELGIETRPVLVGPVTYLLLAIRGGLPLVLSAPAAFAITAAMLVGVGWPIVARGVAAIVRAERQQAYVDAARAAGAGQAYLLRRHLLPAASGFVRTQIALLVPAAVLAESTLSYAGLGFPDTQPSWGTLLRDTANIGVLGSAPWLLAPLAALISVVVAVTIALGAELTSRRVEAIDSGSRVSYSRFHVHHIDRCG